MLASVALGKNSLWVRHNTINHNYNIEDIEYLNTAQFEQQDGNIFHVVTPSVGGSWTWKREMLFMPSFYYAVTSSDLVYGPVVWASQLPYEVMNVVRILKLLVDSRVFGKMPLWWIKRPLRWRQCRRKADAATWRFASPYFKKVFFIFLCFFTVVIYKIWV